MGEGKKEVKNGKKKEGREGGGGESEKVSFHAPGSSIPVCGPDNCWCVQL